MAEGDGDAKTACTLVFDTSTLSSFARAERLSLLEALTERHRRLVTRAVLDELRRGTDRRPRLGDVEVLRWLKEVAVDSLEELIAFASYTQILGVSTRDVGEASTLACVEVNGGIAVLDDQVGVTAARERGVRVRRSLALIASGVQERVMDESAAAELVDRLVHVGGARFPCDGASFLRWTEANGLLVRG